MLKAIEKIETFQGTSQFSMWLIAIGTRLFMDTMRKRKRQWQWQE